MKIFQIGLNKCGTASLYRFFRQNRIKSIHWAKGELAKTIYSHVVNNEKPLGVFEKYIFYSDMEFVSNNQIIEAYKYFKELDLSYPGSKFILNTRDINKWINSRINHKDYLQRNMNFYKLDKTKTIELWKKQWQEHHRNVINYFKSKSNLLIFDMEQDSPNKIVNFIKEYKFTFTSMPWINKKT